VQKTSLKSCDTAVEHEDVSWKKCFSDAECWRSFDFVSAMHKFWPTLSVKPFPKLIGLAEVMPWHFVFKETKVALSFSTLLNPCKVWIHICFTTLTSEWSIF